MAQIGGQNANIVHSVAVLKLRIIDDERVVILVGRAR
jgi:hypothetical protein